MQTQEAPDTTAHLAACDACDGHGGYDVGPAPGVCPDQARWEDCPECEGAGQVWTYPTRHEVQAAELGKLARWVAAEANDRPWWKPRAWRMGEAV